MTHPRPSLCTVQADVTYEDQQKINTFSRLNSRLHDLRAQVSAHKAAAEDYEEAGNEVMLLDDETVPFMVGECLVHLPREDVEERLQKCEWHPPSQTCPVYWKMSVLRLPAPVLVVRC